MRLRLRCSAQYKLADLQWCMVHVPDHLNTVRDLAEHVSKLLELGSHRVGHGAEPPQLMLDGFLVPHDEDVHAVLRDDEVVDVEPSEPTNGELLPLAWSSPASSKRPVESSINGKADVKRLKGGKGGGHPAPMALGWQSLEVPQKASSVTTPVEASVAAVPGRAAPQATDDSDEESSDEEVPSAHAKQTHTAVETAKATALATCTSGGVMSASPPPVSADGLETGFSIFVGGLPEKVRDDELRRYFEEYGKVVSAEIVFNSNTGKSKSFGFVEFADSETRAKVLANGPKMLIAGKMAEVKPKVPKKSGEGGKGKNGKSKNKGKDIRGEGKGKGGKNSKDEEQVQSKNKGKVHEESDDTEEDSSEDEAPKKVPAPAKASTQKPMPAVSNDEMEVQRQMAALGLPVSFTASEMAGGDSDDEEEEEEDEDA